MTTRSACKTLLKHHSTKEHRNQTGAARRTISQCLRDKISPAGSDKPANPDIQVSEQTRYLNSRASRMQIGNCERRATDGTTDRITGEGHNARFCSCTETEAGPLIRLPTCSRRVGPFQTTGKTRRFEGSRTKIDRARGPGVHFPWLRQGSLLKASSSIPRCNLDFRVGRVTTSDIP